MTNEVYTDKGTFRFKDWWWSKTVLLMGTVYLLAFWFGISFERFVPLALLFLCTIIGFSSVGYLLNDLFDQKQDMLAGKKNSLAGKPAFFVLLLFLVSLAFVFLPWLYLPADRFSYSLIVFQLLLFVVYSAPPIRLKERGVAGVITDSLYAHGVPPILAAYTFSMAIDRPFFGYKLLWLFAWQFASGVRNILMHQSEDIPADKRSGSRTFVMDFSDAGFLFSIKYLIITELIFSLAFFVFLGLDNPVFVLCIVAILAVTALAAQMFYKQGLSAMLRSTWRYFPNNLYEKWLPSIFLMLAISADRLYILVLLVHLALFNFRVYVLIAKRIYQKSEWSYYHALLPFRYFISVKSSIAANYSIYYTLRLFGINLKKENTSALHYFRKKLRKN
jgi:hypothetical protein